MSKKQNALLNGVHIFVVAAALILLMGSLGFVTEKSFSDQLEIVDTVTASVNGGPAQTVTLPHSFHRLKPRTPVVLTAQITAQPDDTAYIKSVYAPAKIYLDDRLLFEFGKPDDYPDYMRDPATEVHIIDLDGTGKPAVLRMEFLSPASRSVLTVHPPMIGTAKHVIYSLFSRLGSPLTFSAVQIIYGLSLIFVSLCILLLNRKGIAFFWLGMFSLTTGLWAFGENNFSGLMIKNPTFLYLLAFIGLFTIIMPLLRFVRTIIDFENPKPMWAIELSTALCVAAAMVLQLLGQVSFSTLMYFFHVFSPIVLVAITALTVREAVCCQNITARRFVLPIGLLTLTAVLELANYQFFVSYAFSSLMQLGILLFLLMMGIAAALAMKDSIGLKNKQEKLRFQKSLMDIQAKEQQSRSLLLSQHEQLLRQQRHDLRHHLEVIKEMAGTDNAELQSYLRALTDNIPAANKTFCENVAVNSILSHYEALCRQEHICLTLNVSVPQTASCVSDTDLCTVFGNLLENAVEACERMTEGEPFIKLNSALRHGLITITMDNSFGGKIKKEGEQFRSSKREGIGIGIDSVRSVAQKYGGGAQFSADGSVFLSSVYMKF